MRKKIIITLMLIILIAGFTFGCAKKIDTTTENINQATTDTTQTTADNSANDITGNINGVDAINNDLSDPDVANTENDLNELNW